jgi:hypothetical protein
MWRDATGRVKAPPPALAMMKFIEDHPVLVATVAWIVLLSTCALIL